MNFGLIYGNISPQLSAAIFALSGNIERDHQRHINNLNNINERKVIKANKIETEKNNNLANKNAAIANLNYISSFLETHYKTIEQITNHNEDYSINDLTNDLTNISFTNDIAKTYQLYKYTTLSTAYQDWYENQRWNIQDQQPIKISGFTTFLSGSIGNFGPNYQTNVITYVNDLIPHLIYFCTIPQPKYENDIPIYTFNPPQWIDQTEFIINDNIKITDELSGKIISSLNSHKKHILYSDANRKQLKKYLIDLYIKNDQITGYYPTKAYIEKQNIEIIKSKLSDMYSSCSLATYYYKEVIYNNDQINIQIKNQLLYQINGNY